MKKRTILITESDVSRLSGLIQSALNFRRDWPSLQSLASELEFVKVVEDEEIPSDIVVLNSRIHIRDLDTDKRMMYTLVFPKDANGSHDRLSVLAPIGTAVLGRKVGESFDCHAPAGVRRLRIEEVEVRPDLEKKLETAA